MADVVTLTHRNVCKDGFTIVDTADSGKQSLVCSFPMLLIGTTCQVFLDLPAPWDAVEHAKKALRVRLVSEIILQSFSRAQPTLPIDRKIVRPGYVASVRAWSRFCVLSVL
jgi:tRNA A58 N-methylase Trm61